MDHFSHESGAPVLLTSEVYPFKNGVGKGQLLEPLGLGS